MTGPPASDAPLEQWRAWARSRGLAHLDPEKLRAEARRQREVDPIFGLREVSPEPDVEELRPVLDLDVGALSGIDRAALSLHLEQVAARGAAGTAGDNHPVVVAVRQLAVAVREPGPQALKLRMAGPEREVLDAVLRVAWQTARSEQSPLEPLLRRVLASVERFAYGERGWLPPVQPKLSPDHDRAWSGSEVFRAT